MGATAPGSESRSCWFHYTTHHHKVKGILPRERPPDQEPHRVPVSESNRHASGWLAQLPETGCRQPTTCRTRFAPITTAGKPTETGSSPKGTKTLEAHDHIPVSRWTAIGTKMTRAGARMRYIGFYRIDTKKHVEQTKIKQRPFRAKYEGGNTI